MADHQAYYREAGTALLSRSGAVAAEAFLRECLGARNLVLNASAVVWRRAALRDALQRAGEEAAAFRLALDWRLYAEALSVGGAVAYVATPLNRHRRHAGGVTARIDPALHLDEIRRMHRHINGMVGPDKALAARQRKALTTAKRELAAVNVLQR